jgi:uridine kinase
MPRKKPLLIGIAGGASSGKKFVCEKILDQLTKLNPEYKTSIFTINFDSFYKILSNEDKQKAKHGEYNFDHPNAFDDQLAYQQITDFISGKEISIPVYDCKEYEFKQKDLTLCKKKSNPDVIIIHGILAFYYEKIRNFFQMKLFVDCDADTRLSRRVLCELTEYDRDLDQILNYYLKFSKPCFEDFCLPTKKYADVIIPRGSDNNIAINLIVEYIADVLSSSTLQLTRLNSTDINTNYYQIINNTDRTDALKLNKKKKSSH